MDFWTPEMMPFQMIYDAKQCTSMSGASFFKLDTASLVLHYKISSYFGVYFPTFGNKLVSEKILRRESP